MNSILKLPICTLLVLISPLLCAKSNYNLLLAGGALKTCSSQALHNCLPEAQFETEAKFSALYQITPEKLKKLEKSTVWQEKRANLAKKLTKYLKKIGRKTKGKTLSLDQLKEQFSALGQRKILSKLSDAEWYGLLDHLEIYQTVAQKKRSQEKVQLHFNGNKEARQVVESFVGLSAQKSKSPTPKILVITASSRDPFEAADFYKDLFGEAGAEAIWLPLDAALSRAIEKRECSQLDTWRNKLHGAYERSVTYPDLTAHQRLFCEEPALLIEALNSAQGVFFNGGDQSLTLAALTLENGEPTAFLKALQQRVKENTIVVGGTSAGTAVQSSLVMISNGSSANALKRGVFESVAPKAYCDLDQTCPQGVEVNDVTYRAGGGTQLFPYGLLDTHFSERGRQTRLLRLAAERQVPLAAGVDETTALMVNTTTGDAEVIGAAGVFWLEQAKREGASFSAVAHYSPTGERFKITSQGIKWGNSYTSLPTPKSKRLKLNDEILTQDSFRQLMTGFCLSTETQLSGRVLDYQLTLTKTKGFAATLSKPEQTCYYRNLKITLEPSS